MNNINGLSENYPPIITKEQLCAILHISKRKATWILDNGFIKCKKSKKQTRKYKISLLDVIQFIKNYESHPERYRTPDGMFSNNPDSMSNKYCFPKSLPAEKFGLWLSDEWADLPDILKNTDVAKLTGYTKETVNRWLQNGKLHSAETQDGILTTKTWLIDFYCSHGYVITKMCLKHIKLMKRFLKLN